MSSSELEAESPPIGHVNYFSSLLEKARTAIQPTHIEPVVLEALLLCLISGPRGLVLCVKSQDDINTVVKMTVAILTSVFGISTHKFKTRSKHQPVAFLRALFLPGSVSTVAAPAARPHYPRQRTPSRKSGAMPVTPVIPSPSTSENPGEPLTVHQASDSQIEHRSEAYRANTFSFTGSSGKTHNRSDTFVVPQAIVISGLEQVGLPAQRALMQALADSHINLEHDAALCEGSIEGPCGSWDLPNNFIMVYVCLLDERERPDIQRSLLDHFSLSVNVPIQPSHPRSRSDIGGSLMPSFSSRSLQYLPANNVDPVISSSELEQLRWFARDPSVRALQLPPGGIHRAARVGVQTKLGMYGDGLLTLARHHPILDGTLITGRAHRDFASILRAVRVVRGDSVGGALIQAAAASADSSAANALTTGQGEVISEEGTWEEGDERFSAESAYGAAREWSLAGGTKKSHPSINSGISGESLVPEETPTGSAIDEIWDVSDEDIRYTFQLVLRHRLRVRNGPEELVLGSVMYSAVPPHGEDQRNNKWRRPTVEEILTEILDDKGVI